MSKRKNGNALVEPTGYLSRGACEEFLVQLYFGAGRDYVRMCIDRAYLDFNRTLHGFASHENAVVVRDSAAGKLTIALGKLQSSDVSSQASFNIWHKSTCSELRSHFRDAGFRSFTYGQAQKWVNMTLKYIFVVGEARVPGVGNALRFAHVPVDNIVISAWGGRGMPTLDVAWSRMDDYAEYAKLQAWIRKEFRPRTPLEAEFGDWLDTRKHAIGINPGEA